MLSEHDAGSSAFANDPNNFFVSTCGDIEPNDPHGECEDICDWYCANDPNLPAGNFTRYASGCEGYCLGGDFDGDECEFQDECCPGGPCTGGNANVSGLCVGTGGASVKHANTCNCSCIEIAGAPAPAGGMLCYSGIRTVVEANVPCDGTDITMVQGDQCLVLTSESLTVRQQNLDALGGGGFLTQSATGTRATCGELAVGDTTSLKTVGVVPSYDGAAGDASTLTIQTCK